MKLWQIFFIINLSFCLIAMDPESDVEDDVPALIDDAGVILGQISDDQIFNQTHTNDPILDADKKKD